MADRISQSSLANDDMDQVLQQLALAAQQDPPQNSQQQVAMNRLLQGILKSNRLGHPQKGSWPPSLYADLYNEALSKTCLEVCQKLENYSPERGSVMAWVNCLLKYNFMRVVENYYKHSALPSLDDLDLDIPVDETPSDAQALQKFLEEDPEDLLKAERLRERPEVTFQILILAKYVEDQTWESIADNLDISIQTLCSFFNRRLQKLMPYFHKYLQD
jgi:DNA-directed RNA polymerase specialized sigma24 family protein